MLTDRIEGGAIMKKRLSAILLALVLVFSCLSAGADPNGFADVLRSIDYGDAVTYVIGHKSPDADTIGTAMAYAHLLRQLGINAKAVATAEVNQETRYALDFYGLEPPEVISDAEGKQFVLVDHSEYSQALDGMKDARVVGIVDHHGIGDIRNTERIAVISLPVGATATIVYQLYLDCNVGIPKDMARVMLMSILSDTKGMTSNVTDLDRRAYDCLLSVAEIDDIAALYAGMKDAKASYEGMSPSQIYYLDYKEYLAGEYTFGIGDVYTNTEEHLMELVKMVEEAFPSLYATNNLDMLFCMVSTDEITRLIWYGEDAEKAVAESFPGYDGSGFLTFTPKASRKAVIVPPLTATLEKWTKQVIQSNPAESK